MSGDENNTQDDQASRAETPQAEGGAADQAENATGDAGFTAAYGQAVAGLINLDARSSGLAIILSQATGP